MSLEGFSKLIDSGPIQRFLERKREQVEAIDPQRIYVENVRAFFGVPSSVAKAVLKAAVREGTLERRVGVLCPDDQHIVKSYASEDEVPEAIDCRVCEYEGREETVHAGANLGRLTFYRLVPHSDDG